MEILSKPQTNDSTSELINRELATKPKLRFIQGLGWYIYIAPAIIMLLLIYAYPIFSVVKNSFYAGNPRHLVFVGMSNYIGIFKDPVFWTSIKNNLTLLISVPILIVISLLLAIIIFDAVRGWKVYRFVVFLPYIMPATVIGITFSYLYQYNGGLNEILRMIGLNKSALNWLGDSHLVVPSIMSVIIWQQVGFGVVIFLSQMMSLPEEIFEAATLDGVNWWQKQMQILIPQLRGVIEFFAITEAINMLSWVFNYVYIITGGGPGNSSSVMELYIWRNAFFFRSLGMASSVATILLVFTIMLIFVYFRIRDTKEGNIQ